MSSARRNAADAPPSDSPNAEARIMQQVAEVNAAMKTDLLLELNKQIEASNQKQMESIKESMQKMFDTFVAQQGMREAAPEPIRQEAESSGVPPMPTAITAADAAAAAKAATSSNNRPAPEMSEPAETRRRSQRQLLEERSRDAVAMYLDIDALKADMQAVKDGPPSRAPQPATVRTDIDRTAADHKTLQQMIPRWDGSADTLPSFRGSVEYAFKHTVKDWTQEQKVEWLSRAGLADKAEGIFKQLPTEGKTVDMFLNDLASIANLTTETESLWSNLSRNNDAFNVFAARAAAIYCRRNNANKCDDAVLIDRLICSLSSEVNNAVRMHFRALHNGKDAPITFANLVSCVMSFEMGKAQTRRTAGIGHVNAISESTADADAAAASKALQNISAMTTQAVQAQTSLLAATRDLQAAAARIAAMPMAMQQQPPVAPYAYRQQQQQQQQYQQQPQSQYAAARAPATRGGNGQQSAPIQPATFFAGNCRACKGFGHKASDCPLHQVMSIERVHEMMAQNIADEDDQVAAVDQADAALAAVDPVHSNVTRRL
jgi:hypothetical protein